jgi:hypothetical protein
MQWALANLYAEALRWFANLYSKALIRSLSFD